MRLLISLFVFFFLIGGSIYSHNGVTFIHIYIYILAIHARWRNNIKIKQWTPSYNAFFKKNSLLYKSVCQDLLLLLVVSDLAHFCESRKYIVLHTAVVQRHSVRELKHSEEHHVTYMLSI